MGVRTWAAAAAMLCASQASAAVQSVTFDIPLFSTGAPFTPAPENLAGSVEWTFDALDPAGTVAVSAISVTFGGHVFGLADVGAVVNAGILYVGGIYDGSFPNTINGGVSDFTMSVTDPFTAPVVLGAAATFDTIPGEAYSHLFTPIAAGVPEPSTWAMILLGFLGLALARREGVVRGGADL